MKVIDVEPFVAAGPVAMDWFPLAVAAAIVLLSLLYLFALGRASREARSGLALGLLGLLGKEVRSRGRGWRPVLILTGYLGLLTVGVAGFLALLGRAGGVISPAFGTQLFSALASGCVLMLAFITPALTVGAVSGERERRTLDLLLVTRASPLGLAGGKLVGSLCYVLFLLAASLPAFALVYLFGGVPALYVGMVFAVAGVTALAHASLGLLLSALLKRTIVASVVAYLLVLLVVFGLPFLSALVSVTQLARTGGQPFTGPPPPYMYLSPLVSLTSVLPTGSPVTGVPLVGDLMRIFLMGGSLAYGISAPPTPDITQAVYVVSVDQVTGQPVTVTRLAPWVYHFAYSGALSFLSLALTALLLAPVKPWRAWRFQRRASQTG